MAVTTLPVTEARKAFLEIVREIAKTYARYILTKDGKPVVALMSVEEYEGWLDTLEIAADPEWTKALEEAREDVRRDKLFSFEKVVGRKQKKRRK